ncbi:peptide-methionine (S)-S-oxide reductase MsrA [Microbulbifer guangxiensis]|uniref:peptide-methionine (S)-S-oxide reductase MsrA n=1 Tax=Microbulbifer guangxiensis TaxID=2904249 RepID=UPI001F02C213|nr:peptide-methionine (S)-S-oxide reductase MsrA [Microbulbifer guangxiensis]
MRRLIAVGLLTIAGLLSMAVLVNAQEARGNIQTAVFAGGCFWCMEPPYDKLDGVLKTTSGYSGGKVANPTYEQVSGGGTGHAEVVQVTYDADKISYAQLLDVFWKNVDPLDGGGQFCDRGDQYRSAIFYGNAEEKQLAEASKQQVAQQLGKPVATQVVPEATFYPAEDYHQDYYQRNPVRYKYYRYRCGRDQRLEEVWGAS